MPSVATVGGLPQALIGGKPALARVDEFNRVRLVRACPGSGPEFVWRAMCARRLGRSKTNHRWTRSSHAVFANSFCHRVNSLRLS